MRSPVSMLSLSNSGMAGAARVPAIDAPVPARALHFRKSLRGTPFFVLVELDCSTMFPENLASSGEDACFFTFIEQLLVCWIGGCGESGGDLNSCREGIQNRGDYSSSRQLACGIRGIAMSAKMATIEKQ